MQPTVRRQHPETALRIAVATETYPPEINGVAHTVGLMVEALLARGHSIELLRPRQASERAKADETPSRQFELRLTMGVRIPNYPDLQIGLIRTRRLVEAWSERRPDIVHVITEGPLGWSALRAARKLGIPVVSDFHTNFHDYSRHYGFGLIAGMVERYLRALHNRCDCTIVPTREMRERLRTLGFERLAVVGRGIDTKLFSPDRRSAALRRSWHCADDTPVVLYVGRLAPEKNLRLFIDTVRAARWHRADLRVVMVGDGPMGARLREENPDFLFAGMRRGEDLAAHYASADVFLFPSLSETFGNVTMEALASGLAVIAYDYAAAREHIVHGYNGLVAPCDDEIAFRRHALRLCESGPEVHSLRLRARDTAESQSWSKAFDCLETSLLSFATKAGAAAPERVAQPLITD